MAVKTSRAGRVVADEDPVEPRRFVSAGEVPHEVRIDRGLDRQGNGAIDLRDVVGPDHAGVRGGGELSAVVLCYTANGDEWEAPL